jgi:multidrug efflux system membrane fusion protein
MTRNQPSLTKPASVDSGNPNDPAAPAEGRTTPSPAAPAPSQLQQELDKHEKGGGGWWQWIVVVILLGGAGWYLYGGGTHNGASGGADAKGKGSGRRGGASSIIPVITEPAKSGNIDVVITGVGTVTPLATVTVKSRVEGELVKVLYTEGQMVKEGDMLAQIDTRPFEVALAQAEGQLMRDQALLKNAKLDLERYQGLWKKDAIPQQTLTAQESTVAQYEGTVKTDQAIVDNARLNITYCNITSPLTGRVGLRIVDQGNMVRTGDPDGLVVITQMQPISVVFYIAADTVPAVLAKVHAGQTLKVEAWDPMLKNKLAEGKLLTVDNAVDTTSGTLKCKALFDNKDLSLYPNQFVNAQLYVETKTNVTLVPPSSIQRGAQSPYVYLLNPADNTVSMRNIDTDIITAAAVEVTKGLKPGEIVVTAGADKLQDGSKVTLGQPGGDAAQGDAKTPGAPVVPGSQQVPTENVPGTGTPNSGALPAGAPRGDGKHHRRDHSGGAGATNTMNGPGAPPASQTGITP